MDRQILLRILSRLRHWHSVLVLDALPISAEIFEIIRKQMQAKNAPRALGAGGILTGGGAEYFRSRELFSDIVDMNCRIGVPTDAAGAGVDLDSPRFSAIWGALKVAAFFQQNYAAAPSGGFDRMVSKLTKFLNRGGR